MKSQNCPLGGGAEKLTDMLSLQNWRVYIPASAKANSWTEIAAGVLVYGPSNSAPLGRVYRINTSPPLWGASVGSFNAAGFTEMEQAQDWVMQRIS